MAHSRPSPSPAQTHRTRVFRVLLGVVYLIALSGLINDVGGALAVSGAFGETAADPVTGFTLVYGLEILLLLATIIAIGPLSRRQVPSVEPTLGGASPIRFLSGGLP